MTASSILHSSMRDLYSGSTSASQAEDASSILVSRSSLDFWRSCASISVLTSEILRVLTSLFSLYGKRETFGVLKSFFLIKKQLFNVFREVLTRFDFFREPC